RGQPIGFVSDRLTRADASRGQVNGKPDISKGTINQSIGCIQIPASALSSSGAATWEWPVQQPATLVGGPLVTARGTITSSDATVALRLWDIDPAGTATLITRGL